MENQQEDGLTETPQHYLEHPPGQGPEQCQLYKQQQQHQGQATSNQPSKVKQLTQEEREYWQQRLPRGFQFYLERLARGVIRSQPVNIPAFSAAYLEELLVSRNAELWKLPTESYFVKLFHKKFGSAPWQPRRRHMSQERKLSLPRFYEVLPDMVAVESLPESSLSSEMPCNSELYYGSYEASEMLTASECAYNRRESDASENQLFQDSASSSTFMSNESDCPGGENLNSFSRAKDAQTVSDEERETMLGMSKLQLRRNTGWDSTAEHLHACVHGQPASDQSESGRMWSGLGEEKAVAEKGAEKLVRAGDELGGKIKLHTEIYDNGCIQEVKDKNESGDKMKQDDEFDTEDTNCGDFHTKSECYYENRNTSGKRTFMEAEQKHASMIRKPYEDAVRSGYMVDSVLATVSSVPAHPDTALSVAPHESCQFEESEMLRQMPRSQLQRHCMPSVSEQQVFVKQARENGIHDLFISTFEKVNNILHQTKYFQGGVPRGCYSATGDESQVRDLALTGEGQLGTGALNATKNPCLEPQPRTVCDLDSHFRCQVEKCCTDSSPCPQICRDRKWSSATFPSHTSSPSGGKAVDDCGCRSSLQENGQDDTIMYISIYQNSRQEEPISTLSSSTEDVTETSVTVQSASIQFSAGHETTDLACKPICQHILQTSDAQKSQVESKTSGACCHKENTEVNVSSLVNAGTEAEEKASNKASYAAKFVQTLHVAGVSSESDENKTNDLEVYMKSKEIKCNLDQTQTTIKAGYNEKPVVRNGLDYVDGVITLKEACCANCEPCDDISRSQAAACLTDARVSTVSSQHPRKVKLQCEHTEGKELYQSLEDNLTAVNENCEQYLMTLKHDRCDKEIIVSDCRNEGATNVSGYQPVKCGHMSDVICYVQGVPPRSDYQSGGSSSLPVGFAEDVDVIACGDGGQKVVTRREFGKINIEETVADTPVKKPTVGPCQLVSTSMNTSITLQASGTSVFSEVPREDEDSDTFAPISEIQNEEQSLKTDSAEGLRTCTHTNMMKLGTEGSSSVQNDDVDRSRTQVQMCELTTTAAGLDYGANVPLNMCRYCRVRSLNGCASKTNDPNNEWSFPAAADDKSGQSALEMSGVPGHDDAQETSLTLYQGGISELTGDGGELKSHVSMRNVPDKQQKTSKCECDKMKDFISAEDITRERETNLLSVSVETGEKTQDQNTLDVSVGDFSVFLESRDNLMETGKDVEHSATKNYQPSLMVVPILQENIPPENAGHEAAEVHDNLNKASDNIKNCESLDLEALNMSGTKDMEALNIDGKLDIEALNISGKLDMETLNIDGKLDMEALNIDSKLDIQAKSVDYEQDLQAQNTDDNSDLEVQNIDDKLEVKTQNLDYKQHFDAQNIDDKLDVEAQNVDGKLYLEAQNIDDKLDLQPHSVDDAPPKECILSNENREVSDDHSKNKQYALAFRLAQKSRQYLRMEQALTLARTYVSELERFISEFEKMIHSHSQKPARESEPESNMETVPTSHSSSPAFSLPREGAITAESISTRDNSQHGPAVADSKHKLQISRSFLDQVSLKVVDVCENRYDLDSSEESQKGCVQYQLGNVVFRIKTVEGSRADSRSMPSKSENDGITSLTESSTDDSKAVLSSLTTKIHGCTSGDNCAQLISENERMLTPFVLRADPANESKKIILDKSGNICSNNDNIANIGHNNVSSYDNDDFTSTDSNNNNRSICCRDTNTTNLGMLIRNIDLNNIYYHDSGETCRIPARMLQPQLSCPSLSSDATTAPENTNNNGNNATSAPGNFALSMGSPNSSETKSEVCLAGKKARKFSNSVKLARSDVLVIDGNKVYSVSKDAMGNRDLTGRVVVCDMGSSQTRSSATSQAGSSATPQAGSLGTPQAGFLGTPQAGSAGTPQAGSAGTRQAGSAGTHQAGSAGTRQAGSTGTRQAGSLGAPKAGSSGASQAGSLGMRQTRSSGRPQTGSSNRPQTGSSGRPQTGSSGKPQRGSSGRPQTSKSSQKMYGGRKPRTVEATPQNKDGQSVPQKRPRLSRDISQANQVERPKREISGQALNSQQNLQTERNAVKAQNSQTSRSARTALPPDSVQNSVSGTGSADNTDTAGTAGSADNTDTAGTAGSADSTDTTDTADASKATKRKRSPICEYQRKKSERAEELRDDKKGRISKPEKNKVTQKKQAFLKCQAMGDAQTPCLHASQPARDDMSEADQFSAQSKLDSTEHEATETSNDRFRQRLSQSRREAFERRIRDSSRFSLKNGRAANDVSTTNKLKRPNRADFPVRIRASFNPSDVDADNGPQQTRRLTVESPAKNILIHTSYVRPNPKQTESGRNLELISQKRKMYLGEEDEFVNTDGTRRLICETECFASKDPTTKNLVIENGTLNLVETKIKVMSRGIKKARRRHVTDPGTGKNTGRGVTEVVSSVAQDKSSQWYGNNCIRMIGNYIIIGRTQNMGTIQKLLEKQEQNSTGSNFGTNKSTNAINLSHAADRNFPSAAQQKLAITDNILGIEKDAHGEVLGNKWLNINNSSNNSFTEQAIRESGYSKLYSSGTRQPSRFCASEVSAAIIISVAAAGGGALAIHGEAASCDRSVSDINKQFIIKCPHLQPRTSFARNSCHGACEELHLVKMSLPTIFISSSTCLIFNINSSNSGSGSGASSFPHTDNSGPQPGEPESSTPFLSHRPCTYLEPATYSVTKDNFQAQVDLRDITFSKKAQNGESLNFTSCKLTVIYPKDMESSRGTVYHGSQQCCGQQTTVLSTAELGRQVRAGDVCPGTELQTGYPEEMLGHLYSEPAEVICCQDTQENKQIRLYEFGAQVCVSGVGISKTQTHEEPAWTPPFTPKLTKKPKQGDEVERHPFKLLSSCDFCQECVPSEVFSREVQIQVVTYNLEKNDAVQTGESMVLTHKLQPLEPKVTGDLLEEIWEALCASDHKSAYAACAKHYTTAPFSGKHVAFAKSHHVLGRPHFEKGSSGSRHEREWKVIEPAEENLATLPHIIITSKHGQLTWIN